MWIQVYSEVGSATLNYLVCGTIPYISEERKSNDPKERAHDLMISGRVADPDIIFGGRIFIQFSEDQDQDQCS